MGHVADIFYNAEKIGVVMIKIWNDVRCALPRSHDIQEHGAETTTIFARTGYHIKSCTVKGHTRVGGQQASCIEARSMRCAARKSTFTYRQCSAHLNLQTVNLHDSVDWIGTTHACADDVLEYLTSS